MKKLQAAAVLPLFALASCGQNTQTEVTETPVVETPAVTETVTPTETPVVETATQDTTTLSGEVSATTTTVVESEVTKVEVNAPYKLPNGMDVAFTATLEVKDGFVINVTGLEGKQGSQIAFAPEFQKQVTGKALKGLQIDAVSGASLTTMAVNQYLNTVNQ